MYTVCLFNRENMISYKSTKTGLQIIMPICSIDAAYLSILQTNDFRCVFRYYYGENANTVCVGWGHNPFLISGIP